MATKKNSKSKSKIAKPKLKTVKPAKKATKKAVKKVVKKVAPAKKAAKTERVEARVTTAKPTGRLSASVFDTKGKVAGQITLPGEIFGAKINDQLMSQAVRVYLANQRQGTSKVKDRGEVDRTTKKVYQQKGTGRARHGSRRAPIYVGGGRVFGPRPRDYSLHIAKKMRTLALFSAISLRFKDKQIKIIKGLEEMAPKTKLMAKAFENLGANRGLKVLLVTPAVKGAENVYRAARNIEGVEIMTANSLNAYKVLDNALIFLMRDSVENLKSAFVKK